MKKFFYFLAVCACAIGYTAQAFASSIHPKIVFIPHDDRPVSYMQTVDTIRMLAEEYELTAAPKELLGNRESAGKPDELWSWLFEHAKGKDAVVLSSDSLLYGSLVGSRKHKESKETILERAENFKKLQSMYPNLSIYVFGSIMRTPRSGSSGGEEPGYYAQYGADIFNLTALMDKEETEPLSRREKKQLASLRKSIPSEALNDWMARRDINFSANMKLVDFARQNVFRYLALGRDDNAPFSQTHKESRMLDAASGDLGKSKFQTLAGIDEMGMIMLTRAINDIHWALPFVAVRYADGVGEKTVPTYSDEPIGESIRSHLYAAGAIPVRTTKRADVVLMVNTDEHGVTSEANYPDNTTKRKSNTVSFVEAVESYLAQGYPVAVADISFANGADNALLAEMNRRGLLPKLAAYSGWNTANNSAGFAIGQSILANKMNLKNKNHLLAVRLLDDWAYQANIRQALAAELAGMKDGNYSALNAVKPEIVRRANAKMSAFADDNLKQFELKEIRVDFPWNRMFEAEINVR